MEPKRGTTTRTEHHCENHPDRRGEFFCEKYGRWLCRECAKCPRPTHCKFRPQCVIRELEEEPD